MEARETVLGDSGSSWISRIVVAADGSPASGEGLKQVAELATRTGAKVTVVHVRHVPAGSLLAPGISNPSLLEALDEQEADVRQQAGRILDGTGVDWELVVPEGSPGEEIVRVADEGDADLVVVGSNRHSSLHNRLLGSTAAHLATHARAPVLIMRSRAPSPTEGAAVEAVR
jgi:nucleotide-binding universal stress UspA family protein